MFIRVKDSASYARFSPWGLELVVVPSSCSRFNTLMNCVCTAFASTVSINPAMVKTKRPTKGVNCRYMYSAASSMFENNFGSCQVIKNAVTPNTSAAATTDAQLITVATIR